MPPDEPTTIDHRRLDVRSLLHPYERSRLVLALCAIAVVFGVAAMVIARTNGSGALLPIVAGLAVLGASIWWLLQVHRARLLGQAVRVTEHSLPELQQVIDEVRERLEYRRRVDVYVIEKAERSSDMVSYPRHEDPAAGRRLDRRSAGGRAAASADLPDRQLLRSPQGEARAPPPGRDRPHVVQQPQIPQPLPVPVLPGDQILRRSDRPCLLRRHPADGGDDEPVAGRQGADSQPRHQGCARAGGGRSPHRPPAHGAALLQ
jgi:hypothetical protein